MTYAKCKPDDFPGSDKRGQSSSWRSTYNPLITLVQLLADSMQRSSCNCHWGQLDILATVACCYQHRSHRRSRQITGWLYMEPSWVKLRWSQRQLWQLWPSNWAINDLLIAVNREHNDWNYGCKGLKLACILYMSATYTRDFIEHSIAPQLCSCPTSMQLPVLNETFSII